jgi:hypothetical protein
MHVQISTATKFSCQYGTTVRLTAVNYEDWKANVEVILMGAHCYKLVAGEETKPEAVTMAAAGRASTRGSSSSTATPTPADREPTYKEAQTIKRIEDWEKRFDLAYSLLYSSLSDTVQLYARIENRDPTTLWKSLQTKYDTKGSLHYAGLIMRDWYKEAWKKNDTYASYEARLRSYQARLPADGPFTLKDEQISVKLLTELPSHWHAMAAYIQTSIPNLGLVQVCQALAKAETLVGSGGEPTDNGTGSANALSAEGRGGRNGRGGRGGGRRGRGGGRGGSTQGGRVTKDGNCYNCGKKGHYKYECRIPKEKEKNEKGKDKADDEETPAKSQKSAQAHLAWDREAMSMGANDEF